MKKIFLLLLLILPIYANEAQFYIGASLGGYHESLVQNNAVVNEPIATLKVGYGERNNYAVEFSVDYIQNDSQIFSSGTSTDKDRYGFNLALLKAYDFDIYVLPYIKAGFGSGYMKITRAMQNKISYGSYNLATGIFIPINKTFDIEIGYEYRYLSYQSVNTIAQRVQYKAHANIISSGLNIRF